MGDSVASDFGLPNMPNYNLGPLIGSSCDTTGINGVAKAPPQLSIYPNPAQNTATIEWPPTAGEDTRLAIYDTVGNPVYNLKTAGATGRTQIDISTLPNGLYVVKLYMANGGVVSGKMCVIGNSH